MFRCAEHPREGEYAEHTEWLQVIWKVNELRLDPVVFGQPENKPWWAGGMVEEYAEARVIFAGDDTVRIVGKTPEAEDLINRAARALGFTK